MQESHNGEKPNIARPKTNPRGYSINVVFLLLTVCAVIAGMISSGARSTGGNSVREEVAVVVGVVCTLVGLIVGGVVGSRREPKGRNIALGIVVGMLSGGAAAAFFAFPPTPAALLIGCVLLVGTAGLMRSVQS